MTDEQHFDNSTHDDLIAAYALGALSAAEQAQVESLLASSEAARSALRDYQAMMVGYAALGPVQQAPANLTDDFRKRLVADSANKPQPALRLVKRRSLLFTIAAIFIVALVGVGLYSQVNANNQQRTINTILAAGQRVALAAQPGASGKVEMVMVPNVTKIVLVTELPSLPSDKQYQLWMIKGSQMDSALVFSADQATQQLLIDLPVLPTDYEAIGLTIEPRLGSKQPTTGPIFVGEIS
jgi:anti-sigma-K factor RskA